ncbi:hypothetical protein [Pasteuria penetrans]|uniref:hypothetical protein n=1 Tax=Pasteuria penetrans TaxID=86005 RepID=UPI000FC32CCF|nr:hypothetical protein [Pasteuria penetrans]
MGGESGKHREPIGVILCGSCGDGFLGIAGGISVSLVQQGFLRAYSLTCSYAIIREGG